MKRSVWSAAMSLCVGWKLIQAGHVRHEDVMFTLPNSLGDHQLSTAYHAQHLCYLVCDTGHASADRVYGIAPYLAFLVQVANLRYECTGQRGGLTFFSSIS